MSHKYTPSYAGLVLMASMDLVLGKRHFSSVEDADDSLINDGRPYCKYGRQCYRKNLDHLREYAHPVDSPKRMKVSPHFDEFSEDPFRIHSNKVPVLLTAVRGIDQKFNHESLAVTLEDILAWDCDKLRASVQFNYMIDIPWLMAKYPQVSRDKPLLIVTGDGGLTDPLSAEQACAYSNILLLKAPLPITYGTHHTKMMLLFYADSMRVVIHTANLIEDDWDQKTQGVWISPTFRKIDACVSSGVTYDPSQDVFKKDLLEYLDAYRSQKLLSCIKNVREHDMTNAGVHLIASVPGRHTGTALHKWGHLKLRSVLHRYGLDKSKVTTSWPVVGQFSSIGSLGNDEKSWLCGEWLESLSSCGKSVSSETKSNSLQLIFPTVENVRLSLGGYSSGASLPYNSDVARRQPYLEKFLHRWVADRSGRSKASPHIKTYARFSDDYKHAAWFLITSANLSKAAWGSYEKNRSQLMIRSYELGVLFLPIGKEDRAARESMFHVSNEADANAENCTYLKLPYDVPPKKYSLSDKPWMWDVEYLQPDSHEKLWKPS